MIVDNSIFGIRFGSNATLQPTQEELRLFLESREKEGRQELRGNVLAPYTKLLEEVMSFQRRQLHGVPSRNVREKMFYGVLNHSLFFNPALRSSVEQYKYHVHTLRTLNFKKPGAFIKAAEEAITRLNPKKKADADKLVKFRDMADERKKLLETLTRRRAALVEELGNIAMYIRNNLVKIENRCETAIVVLADSHVARKKENELIENVKTRFKEQLKNDLHSGLVTRQHLEAAKQDVSLLSKEISNILRDNFYALTRLYEAIYDRTKEIVRDIDALMAENQGKRNKSFAEDVEHFTQIEHVIDALISGDQLELKMTDIQTETAYKNILLEKRKEMLDYLYELLQKERRSWMRRSRDVRRRDDGLIYRNPQRRTGYDRRAGADRRKFANASL